MNHSTNAQLVQALRNEEPGAIEEAYRRYGDDILAYAQRKAPSVAEDIHQQVFFALRCVQQASQRIFAPGFTRSQGATFLTGGRLEKIILNRFLFSRPKQATSST